MENRTTGRPLRTRKLPAKFSQGATANELSTEFDDQTASFSKPTNRPHLPEPTPEPVSSQNNRKRRGRPPKVIKNELQVAVVIPVAGSTTCAIVTGQEITDILDTATEIISSTKPEPEERDSDVEGKPTTKLGARFKTSQQLEKDEKKKIKASNKDEKLRLGKLTDTEFAEGLIDTKTVHFNPLQQGPYREPGPKYPPETDLDSPFAIFSLFWTEKMWEDLARNTNAYALRQGAVERGRNSTGSRQHDNKAMNQRAWWPTNTDELKVYVGVLIYMGVHPEGETSIYWNTDILLGPKHTPAKWISQQRFTQIQRFLHCSPEDEAIHEPTGEEIEHMTAAQKRETDQRWWRKMEPLISSFRENCRSY